MYDFPLKSIALSFGKLAYVEKGEKQTILFIHGLGGNIRHWQKQIKELSREYHCIAVDLPGYGWSDKNFSTGGKPRLQFYADLLEEFLAMKKIDSVVVAGHSMGAQIAVLLALQSRRVKKLILVSPAGLETFTDKEAQLLLSATPSSFFEKQDETLIRKNIELNFYQPPADADLLVADRLRLKSCLDFSLYCQQVSESIRAMLAEPVKKSLGLITQPVLLLFGDKDALIPNRYLHPEMTTFELAQQASRIIPDCRLQMIRDAGHLLPYEKSRETAAVMKNFMH